MTSFMCATFFCQDCKKETKFLPIHFAATVSAVSRRTIYDWMEHGWVHWRKLPSGRRVICEQSLSHHVQPEAYPATREKQGSASAS
jgi:hypothetical protein